MSDMETTGSRIKALREAVGMTQEAFAGAISAQLQIDADEGEATKVSRGAVGNWELSKPVGLRNLRAISKRFNVSFDWLVNGEGQPPNLLESTEEHIDTQFRIAPVAPVHAPPERHMIEMRGVARGSIVHDFEGVQIESEVIDRVPCPPHLAGVKGLYGIYIEGDSMEPMHNPGEPRLVHPGRPVAPGDTVIVQTRRWDDDPGQGYIKIFRRRRGDMIVLEQLNPRAVLEIPVQYVVSVHHVLTMSEVLGFG
jgi:phage repressor protein C with HTH and peptisase S24 domain